MIRKLDKIKAMRVFSDNFDGILMTPEAYRELLLTMSTGDYSTHKAVIEYIDDFSAVITTNDLYDPFFNPEEYIKQSEPVTYINNVIHVDFVRKVRI